MNDTHPHLLTTGIRLQAGWLLLRAGGFSLRVRARDSVLIGLCLLALAAVAVAALMVGDTMLGPGQVIDALRGAATRGQRLLVRDIRLPRVLAAGVTGIALATAGCLLQTVARNRLASPSFIGVNEGAMLAVILAMTNLDNATMGPWWVAPLGSAVAGCAMVVIAGRAGSASVRVIVVGVALAVLLRSVNELMMSRVDLRHASELYAWSMGSLATSAHPLRRGGLVVLLALVPLAVLVNRPLSLMRLHSETAISLGLNLRLWQALVFFAAVALAGIGVGIGGPIVFIGLAAPIAASRLIGWSPQIPIVPTACIGAILVITCDTLGRIVVPGDELPVGVLTSIMGGPVLLWVLLTDRRTPARG